MDAYADNINQMRQYDYLIVGSGLFGATFAYKARQLASQQSNVIFGGRLAEYKYYDDMAPIPAVKFDERLLFCKYICRIEKKCLSLRRKQKWIYDYCQ